MALDIAVSAALALVEKVISFVDKLRNIPRTVRDDLEKAKICLQRMDAYLTASQDRIDEAGNQGQLEARVKQVRDVAHEIEDAVDEFMLQVPDHSQYTRWYSGLSHTALSEQVVSFPSRIKDIIQNKISFIGVIDGLTQDSQLTNFPHKPPRRNFDNPPDLEDGEIVGFDEHKKNSLHS
ncbi:hypothetical protein M0R45_014435 [Rubus argutus]|uniref:Disease resistance N-terminal domain-containing protein n=1 Tax=Rubus argutus TaxID=59490 RepID=A0AAW1XMY0_RUBAR